MGLRARPEPVINESGVQVTLDGVDLTNDVTGGTLFTTPVVALGELRVATFGIKAEQGRSNDATAQITTKAGTNGWHGTASFFRRGN